MHKVTINGEILWIGRQDKFEIGSTDPRSKQLIEAVFYGNNYGNIYEVALLVPKVENINQEFVYCSHKWTLLSAAVHAKNLEVIKFLLDQEDINIDIYLDSHGENPLMHAISLNDIEIASLLLNKGANPNIVKGNNITVTYAAKQSPEMLDLMLNSDEKLVAQDADNIKDDEEPIDFSETSDDAKNNVLKEINKSDLPLDHDIDVHLKNGDGSDTEAQGGDDGVSIEEIETDPLNIEHSSSGDGSDQEIIVSGDESGYSFSNWFCVIS